MEAGLLLLGFMFIWHIVFGTDLFLPKNRSKPVPSTQFDNKLIEAYEEAYHEIIKKNMPDGCGGIKHICLRNRR